MTQHLTRNALALSLVAAACAAGFSSTASAQGLSERIKGVADARRDAAANDTSKGKLLGALLYQDVTVAFDKTAARDAFAFIGQQLGVPLVVRFQGDGGKNGDAGIDPEMEITLNLESQPALTVIEQLLELCGTDEECEWQLRNGYIECGTVGRLSVPAARELRTYPVRDLLFEPPTFDNAPDFNLSSALSQGGQGQGGQGGGQGGGGGGGGFGGGGGGGGFGGGGGGGGSGGGGGIIGDAGEDPERLTESEQADKLIEIIKQQCGGDSIWVDDEAPDAIASIRYYSGNIIVRAPDYVHRMIDGYPFAPVRPRSSVSNATEAISGAAHRYVTFTSGLSIVQNLKFTSVPVQGAVAGSGTTNP